MTTKVLLIFPTTFSSPQKGPPLSILHVGESLRLAKSRGWSDEDYKVSYCDERYDPISYIEQLVRHADVVGVSAMTGGQLGRAIRWLKLAKKYGARTILGGVHVTMQPEQCLVEDYVDAVVLGPGERGIIEAIHGGPKQVVNIPLKPEDQVSPVNEHTLFHFQRAVRTQDVMLMTSRGCRWNCSFCYNLKFYNRKWMSVDLQRWRQDIIYLKEILGVTKLESGDDWIGSWDRAKGIVNFLNSQDIKYTLGLRANQINDEVAKEMAELKAHHVIVGMESGSSRLLSLAQKDITNEDQLRTANALAKYNIRPQYTWIYDFPTETKAELNMTFDMVDLMEKIHRGNLTQVLFAYRAMPGAPMWDLVDKALMPKSMEEWGSTDIGFTNNKFAKAVYHVGGLVHHRRRDDKTDRNFPGLRRLIIAPFELLARLRWKLRYFGNFAAECWAIERLLKWASRRRREEV